MAAKLIEVEDSDSNSDSDSEIPSAEVCDGFCKEFASITATDSALAMMYLQRNKWILKQALEKYFEDQGADMPNLSVTSETEVKGVKTVKNLLKQSSASSDQIGETKSVNSVVDINEEDSDSDNDSPSAEVCDSLCQEFALVTATDSVKAMMYLQKSKWSLEHALEQYFSNQRGVKLHSAIEQHMEQSNAGLSSISSVQSGASSANMAAKDANPFRIRVLSWNIDGLDLNNIQTRTAAACQKIMELNPDVVFLQEVVPQSLQIITTAMKKSYLCIAADDKSYFTIMLLNKSTVMHESHQVIPFYTSKMGRNILESEVNIKGIPFLLITSHLESTAQHKAERLRQMKKCIEQMHSAPMSKVVLFGGDLNARDKELSGINFPSDVIDIWEYCGKRKEAQYTWDMKRNDNLDFPFKNAKCRFDRFYFRADEKKSVKPVYFELVGLERLQSCRRFISDHWGILSHYNIVGN